MPLKIGSSKKTFASNMSELMKGKVGSARKKAIKTLAKKKGISPKKARQKQAIAIAFAQKRK
jgi:hypothetical protein